MKYVFNKTNPPERVWRFPCVHVAGLGIALLLVNCAQAPSSVDDVPPPEAAQAEVEQPEVEQAVLPAAAQESDAMPPEVQHSEAEQPMTQQAEQPMTRQSDARQTTPSFQEFREGLVTPPESRIVRPITPRRSPESVEEAAPEGAAEEQLAELIPEPEAEAQGWGPEEYYIEGLNHYNRGNYQSAINSFNQALDLGAEDPAEVYNQLGLAYHQQENFDEAIEHYTAALDINDKYADVYLNRADVYFEIGDSERAAADYQRWEGLNSK